MLEIKGSCQKFLHIKYSENQTLTLFTNVPVLKFIKLIILILGAKNEKNRVMRFVVCWWKFIR